MIRLLLLTLLLALGACSKGPTFHADENPADLSDWGVLDLTGGRLKPADGTYAYTLVTPLFSDYAGKLRTVWVPKGLKATTTAAGALDFPVGTVISKTFFYRKTTAGLGRGDLYFTPRSAGELDLRGVQLVETRLLVRRAAGWVGLPYVWNTDQTAATLARTGDIHDVTLTDIAATPVTFAYQVPNANQCAQCHATNHTTKQLHPIGLATAHINHPGFGGGPSQLTRLVALGMLDRAPVDAPATTDWRDTAAPLDARARAYLEINCAHCHNAHGAAITSGLQLEPGVTSPLHWGLCKAPIAAGQGSGDRSFDIVPGQPDQSVLLYRLQSTDPARMMPELGRSVEHREGVALIRSWIQALPGSCAG